MGLKDVLLEMAAEMEETAGRWADAPALNEVLAAQELRGFAKQLRTAVKTAGDATAPVTVDALRAMAEPPEVFNRRMIEQAKAEFRSKKPADLAPAVLAEEGERPGTQGGEQMVECVGGSHDGVAVPNLAGMPNGARRFVPEGGDEIYELRAGKLYFVKKHTKPSAPEVRT